MSIFKSEKKAPKLTKTQMRIAVAKDVLKQLKLRKIIAKFGVYTVTNSVDRVALGALTQQHTDLQDALKVITKPCEVCAVGSLLMSYARLYDEVPLENSATLVSYHHGPVMRLFGKWQTQAIENTFEGWREPGEGEDDSWWSTAPERRLKRIMNNIVKNGGKFVPWKKA